MRCEVPLYQDIFTQRLLFAVPKAWSCRDIPGCWVDVWRSGTFCTAMRWPEPEKLCKCSVAVWSVVAIGSTLTFLRLCHSSTCPLNVQVDHCTWQVLPGLLPRCKKQTPNTGVKRPQANYPTHDQDHHCFCYDRSTTAGVTNSYALKQVS